MHTHRVRVYAETTLDTVTMLSTYHDGDYGPAHSHSILRVDLAVDNVIILAAFEGHSHRVNSKTGATSGEIRQAALDEVADMQTALD